MSITTTCFLEFVDPVGEFFGVEPQLTIDPPNGIKTEIKGMEMMALRKHLSHVAK